MEWVRRHGERERLTGRQRVVEKEEENRAKGERELEYEWREKAKEKGRGSQGL